MTESHPLQSVIHNIIERYLGRYESVSVGIYRFHAINGGEFSKYLNSLKITLSRKHSSRLTAGIMIHTENATSSSFSFAMDTDDTTLPISCL